MQRKERGGDLPEIVTIQDKRKVKNFGGIRQRQLYGRPAQGCIIFPLIEEADASEIFKNFNLHTGR